MFAGQEPTGVWVGWVTPDYHQYDLHFDLSKVRNVTVTVGDDKGNIHDRLVSIAAHTHTHTHTHTSLQSRGVNLFLVPH